MKVVKVTGGDYVVEGDSVFRTPTTKHFEDGTSSGTFGFLVCDCSPYAEGSAREIARLLNGGGLSGAVDHVRAFHRACDVPVEELPAMPSAERQVLRRRLLWEEFEELIAAMHKPAFKAPHLTIAQELVDLIYVSIGTALEYGIPLDAVWQEVHRANMAKADPETGKVRKREDGKILKPDGWTPPDVLGVIVAACGPRADA